MYARYSFVYTGPRLIPDDGHWHGGSFYFQHTSAEGTPFIQCARSMNEANVRYSEQTQQLEFLTGPSMLAQGTCNIHALKSTIAWSIDAKTWPLVPTTLTVSIARLALSVKNTDLNAALKGTPRTITVTNTGLADAKGQSTSISPVLPTGSSFTTNCEGVLPVGGSCQVTVTPGLTPTGEPLTAPVPSRLRVAGENTNTSRTDILILSYGNIYQAGYVFKLDDSTAPTASVGGKVLALSPELNEERWGPDGPTDGLPYGNGRATTQAIVDLFQVSPRPRRHAPAVPPAVIRLGTFRVCATCTQSATATRRNCTTHCFSRIPRPSALPSTTG